MNTKGAGHDRLLIFSRMEELKQFVKRQKVRKMFISGS